MAWFSSLSGATQMFTATADAPLYRIDKFLVPIVAKADFLQRIQRTHALLDSLAGCQQNLVLLGAENGQQLELVTVVQWRNADACAAAKAVVQAHYAEEGFDPGAFMRALGVRADIGSFQVI